MKLLAKVLLCCMAMSALSGCEVIAELVVMGAQEIAEGDARTETDIEGAWGTRTVQNTKGTLPLRLVKPGTTTKHRVLKKLRTPEDKTSDDQFFLYRYRLQTYIMSSKPGSERTLDGPPREIRLLIWFDQGDTVKQRQWHECAPSADPRCHSENQLCEMIKGLQKEHLITEYC